MYFTPCKSNVLAKFVSVLIITKSNIANARTNLYYQHHEHKGILYFGYILTFKRSTLQTKPAWKSRLSV